MKIEVYGAKRVPNFKSPSSAQANDALAAFLVNFEYMVTLGTFFKYPVQTGEVGSSVSDPYLIADCLEEVRGGLHQERMNGSIFFPSIYLSR